MQVCDETSSIAEVELKVRWINVSTFICFEHDGLNGSDPGYYDFFLIAHMDFRVVGA